MCLFMLGFRIFFGSTVAFAQRTANDCLQTAKSTLERLSCLCHARGNPEDPHYGWYAMAGVYRRMAKDISPQHRNRKLLQWVLRKQSDLYHQHYIQSSTPQQKSRKNASKKSQKSLREHFTTYLPLHISPAAPWVLEGYYHICKSTNTTSSTHSVTCRLLLERLPPSMFPSHLKSCVRTEFTLRAERAGFRLPPDTYLLRIAKPGFAPHYQAIALQDRQRHPLISIQLRPLLASLQIASQPTGAMLTLQAQDSGDRKTARSPHLFSALQPGSYRVTLTHPQFPARQEVLQLCSGCKHVHIFSLSPPTIQFPPPLPTSSPKFRSLAISLGVSVGLTTLSLLGGITTGILGQRERDWSYSFAYYSNNWRSSYETGQQLTTASQALYITSGVMGVASIALLITMLYTPDTVITTRRKNPPPPTVTHSATVPIPPIQRQSLP